MDKKKKTHNRARHNERPERCHGVCFDSLQDGHVVFRILSLNGSSFVLGRRRLF
jgi:hypothetical protein